MAGRSSDNMLRQVHRLFNLGVVGTMTDAQLLDWFVSRRDEAAEAAFEELMIRHGPMVFRVCRSVLHDTHDAEDAFQAAFLVLAHRARSIRRHGSVASWLFGVAHRVASRAKGRTARRRALDQRVAVQNPENYLPADECHDWVVLHEEIDRLPERLRAPVTLCYLEGLTYEAAAHQLKLSEGMVRGRLARARERLRRRLTRRGVTVPTALLVAGSASQAQAAIPTPLVHSTIRIALGFMAGNTAAVLARGVLNSMLLNQLKVAMVLLLVAIGSSYWGWRVLAAAIGDKGQAGARQVVGKTPAAAPVSAPKSQTKAPTSTFHMTGSVRLEGTGEPIAGAKLQITLGNINARRRNEKVAETGADGRFVLELPAGNARVWLIDPPSGYLVSSRREVMEDLVVGPDQPVIHRDYHVRKGTIWNVQFTRGADQKPFPGFVGGSNFPELFQAQANDRGQAQLTLPTEGGKVTLSVFESSPVAAGIQTGVLNLSLQWEPNFRPDELEEILRLEGNDRRFRLIDADAKSATLQVPDPIEPVNDKGKLVIRVAIPYRDSKDFGALTGQVLDSQERPVAGARVAVSSMGRRDANDLSNNTTTDAQGRYRLRDIPRRAIDGKPLRMRIVVTKEGYAGLESPFLTLKEGGPEKPQVVDPIRLVRGVAVSGIVLDHRGKPLVGAEVQSNQPSIYPGQSGAIQSIQTDGKGRFTIRGVHRGVTQLFVSNGTMFKTWIYLADGSPEEARLQLPERRPEFDVNPALLRAPSPKPLALGQTAPQWQVGPWSDGRARKLVDDRGKVVVLYFWGMPFWESVSALPALGKLAAKFEPRGVEFLAIHNADLDAEHVQKQARRVLAFKDARLVFALDQTRIRNHARGKTADGYGVNRCPTVILIDRAGKIAFRSDTATGDRNVTALFNQMAVDPKTITEEKANQLTEKALAREIERVLKPKD
ncbi:MAG: sigma-70 family RNA polymerase sigma factor [Isosphaerales bacterium]